MRNLFLLLLFVSSSAQAVGTNAVFGLGVSTGSFSEMIETSDDIAKQGGSFVLGMSVYQNLLFGFDLEAGLLYAPRGFKLMTTSGISTVSLKTVQLPVLLKWYFLPIAFVGGGLYFSHAFSASDAYHANERGWIMSGGVKAPLSDLYHFLAEVRYLSGTTNISQTPGMTIHLKDFQILAGFSFLL